MFYSEGIKPQVWFGLGGFEDTFACAVRPTEHRALLDTPKRFEHFPHVGVSLLFPQHAHKQLPVF